MPYKPVILKLLLFLITIAALASCATGPSPWRTEAMLSMDLAQMNEAPKIFPKEYEQGYRLIDEGDRHLSEGNSELSENRYKEAWVLAQSLQKKLDSLNREREQEHLDRMDAVHLEISRKNGFEANIPKDATAEKALSEQKNIHSNSELESRNISKPKHTVTSYTVKLGESLPQIASKQEIYADRRLWPLIYSSNRDQISDPRRLWPGQTLRIPRNITSDDINEAKRFASKTSYF